MYFRVKDGYHMFDAHSGEPMWAHKTLPDFDGKYTLLIGEEYLLYSTKQGAARLNMVTGKVGWSMALDNVKFKDVNDSWWTDHGRLFQIKKSFTLLDVENGEELWSVALEPKFDLANKRGLDWLYDFGDRLLILAKDGPVILDAKTGETLLSIKGKYNGKADPVVSLDNQLMFFFDKRITLVDLATNKETISIEGKVEETSAFETIEIGGKTYVFFGFNNTLVAFDSDNGQKVWQTPEGSVEGSVRWLQAGPDSDSVLLITLRADRFGGDAGTWLKMYSLNVKTGAINWSQMIGYSQAASVFVNKAFNAEPSTVRGADISIWFEEPIVDGDNLIFLMKGVVLGDPVTLKRDGSQGFISINTHTGEVNYQAGFEILHPKGKGYGGLAVGPLHDFNDAYPDPIEVGSLVIAAGLGTLNGVDKSSGKIVWQTELPGIATDITETDGALVCQIGKMIVNTAMEKAGEVKTKASGVKPYGFVSIDAKTGDTNWSATDFKVDPTMALAATVDAGVLYGSDGYNSIITTWSNPRRVLRPEYRDTHFIVFGDKQIIRINKDDGKLAWSHRWKYTPKHTSLLLDPTFYGANDDITYACNGFAGLDGKTGEVKWFDKDVKGKFTLVSDDLLVVRKKNKVKGYSLK